MNNSQKLVRSPRTPSRLRVLLGATLGLCLVATWAVPGSAVAAPANPTVHTAHITAAPKPGVIGGFAVLDDHADYSGLDLATDAKGNAYVGWIANTNTNNSATRAVHLCTIRPGTATCAGGVQVIDSLGDSSAAGLRVLVTPAGKVTMVWFHDTAASINGPEGARIATATSVAGGPLTAATDVAEAPSFGELLAAALAPTGQLWTVASGSVAISTVQVHEGGGVTNVRTLATPYGVSNAALAFNGSTPVLVVQKAGAITVPVAAAYGVGAAWTGFRTVAHTWTAAANLGLVGTRSGVRLYTSVANADYWPVVLRWAGTAFTAPSLIGDRNSCAPNSHDPVTDASGRVADVGNECGNIAVDNLPDTLHAAQVRFWAHGTVSDGGPQIATTARGIAFVAWPVESTNGNKLFLARVLLPTLRTSVSRAVPHGRITLTGPASCMTPVGVPVSVTAKAAARWKVSKRVVTLGAHVVTGTLNGAALRPGVTYTLVGHVTFVSGRSHYTGTAGLPFRVCAGP